MSEGSVTIRDVARAVGLSVATVSRALNGASNVLPETRQRVLEAAQQLQFTPSSVARSLSTRRHDCIGLLLPDLHGEYFSELIRGIDQAARARGLALLVSSSHDDADEAASALRAMNGRVDGLLLMSPHADTEFLRSKLPARLPTVLLNTAASLPDLPRLGIDNFGGARAMSAHLVAQLQERPEARIAFIAGPAGNHEAAERLRGFRAALPARMQPWVLEGDFSEDSGYAAGRQLMRGRERPAAVFAANDMMAIGCLRALREAGMAVPRDVALAGFDDIPISRYLTPALSTVRVPIAQLGVAAFNTLLRRLEDPEAAPDSPQTLPLELVLRHSCGANPS
ncbi:MAG: LacI family DNA-binding transcriptional regulator [Burkholderiales bacterium]|uniref:LacI family DNA-binding transcriptional regulator n=1 Tax=Inhella sp. TaxID=1921806 RepID=UPI001AC7B7A8|nr:LacI family DNA-binding transcriptional regulator [Burkholderiales bacterium]